MSGQEYNQNKLSQDFQRTSINDGDNNQKQQNQQADIGGYDPNSAQTFIPQQGYQAYGAPGGYQQYQGYNSTGGYQQGYQGNNVAGGYQQGYQTPGQGANASYNQYQNYNNGGYQNYGRGGYNDNYNRGGYNSYQAPQQQQQSQPASGMSLADFQKQQTAASAALNKPKKTLKLASSSGIKLVGSKKPADSATASKDAASSKKDSETPAKSEKSDVATPKEKTEVESKDSQAEAVTSKEEPKVEKQVLTKQEKSTEKAMEKKAAQDAVTAATLAKQQEEEVDEEVVKDMFGGKDHVSIIFMGHVDAGKSTMGGNILYLTGSVDKRTIEKYEREAKDAGRQGWYLSWVMDTNKEERNDGKTIEVGKAYFETEKRRYTILDAPGHKMYVSEMIGGASQADVGILVISARKGEYETGFEKGGQTREHALLAKTQGVNKIIVVVNKMDDPTVGWSEDRYKDCTTKLGAFLKGIGYSKEDVIFMPVSGYTGAGLKDRVGKKDCPWYSGPSLLEYLDEMKTVDRHINSPFMLPVSGKMKDMGTVVEGKVESGHVKKGSKLVLMPNKNPIEVLTIYNETEQECDAAYSGEQVRLRLKGVEEEEVNAGYVLSSPINPVNTVTRFEAQIAIVELKSILSNGFSCVMHLHTAIEEVKFVELKHKLEKGTNRKSKKPPAFAKKGMKIIAILEASEAVCAETYNAYQQLGRFTLRDQGTTIAIGKITKLL